MIDYVPHKTSECQCTGLKQNNVVIREATPWEEMPHCNCSSKGVYHPKHIDLKCDIDGCMCGTIVTLNSPDLEQIRRTTRELQDRAFLLEFKNTVHKNIYKDYETELDKLLDEAHRESEKWAVDLLRRPVQEQLREIITLLAWFKGRELYLEKSRNLREKYDTKVNAAVELQKDIKSP